MKGSSKRPSRVYSCLIFSVFTVATRKAHQYPFRSLKYPLLRQVMPRIQGASASHSGVLFLLVPCQAHLSLQYRQLLASPCHSRYPDGFCVPISWCHQCPLCTSLQKPYTSVGLMSQAIESTQSSVPGHPFPSPGQRLGSSILVPGQSIHCLTLAVPDQKSLHQDQGR